MRLPIALLTIIATAPMAFAECATPQDTFLSCTFSNGRKAVDVCVEGDMLTYSFGRTGKAPDLALLVPVVDADYTPWPGIGRAIWETVTFHNGKTSYVVAGVIDRKFSEEETADISGLINVVEGEETLATFDCDPGSVDFAYGGSIYDAKTAAGQCYNLEEQRWENCQ
ncbi:hypothetical protein [Profundibacter sp.]|uniref:hypothetical protein n=1 Tax=Profundibacter sp. TaxID=3101071 RepID=UPI003D0A399C